MTGYTIRDLPPGERPRERMARLGSQALSTAELLAIILQVGSGSENVLRLSERLMAEFGGLPGLTRASLGELQGVKGVGPAKASQLQAVGELGRRLAATAPEERPTISSPADAANLLMSEMAFLEQEQLRVVLLDTRNRVLGIRTIYVGSVNTAVVRLAEVFRPAIRENATAIIVTHNHPSGDPTPSPEDVSVTREMVKAGKLLDLKLLDHLIIGRQRYVSLKERGLGFSE